MKKLLFAFMLFTTMFVCAEEYGGVDVGTNPILIRETPSGWAVISQQLCALREIPLARSVLLTIKTPENAAIRLCVSDFSGKLLAYAQEDGGKIMQYEFSMEGYKPFKQTRKQLTY